MRKWFKRMKQQLLGRNKSPANPTDAQSTSQNAPPGSSVASTEPSRPVTPIHSATAEVASHAVSGEPSSAAQANAGDGSMTTIPSSLTQDSIQNQPSSPPLAYGSVQNDPALLPATSTTAQTPSESSVQNPPPASTSETQPESRHQPKLWDEAVERALSKASDDEKKWITSIRREMTTKADKLVVDEMICLARTKQAECEKRKWHTFEICGRNISFRDTASKVIVWLHKFKEIGDIVVQYDPVHAALPWAAARLILMAVVASEEEMAASLFIIEKTTTLVHRCRIFELMYNHDKLSCDATKGLQSALVVLYAVILQGLARVGSFLSKGRAAKSFRAFFDPAGTSSLLSKLADCEDQVTREFEICEAQRSANADAELTERMGKLQRLLHLEKPLLRVDENVDKVLKRMEVKDLIEVLQWISPTKHNLHHKLVSEKRTTETCDWLLGHIKFYEWQTVTWPVTLWLQGFPGSGKTYLTSRVIDKIRQELSSENNDEGFAFFYCNRTESERREALTVLRSYVRQLSRPNNVENSMYPKLEELYTNSKVSGSGWTIGLCKEYLVQLFSFYPRTTLILDALDECHVGEREILLDFFDSLAEATPKPVRIFISSRPQGDIRTRLIHLANIDILATDNQKDIDKFVAQSIKNHKRRRGGLVLKNKPELEAEVIKTLSDKSKGMFQWAMLQIQQLLDLGSEAAIRARLGKLPSDLKSTYDEIYSNIDLLGEDCAAQAQRALQWVMVAGKPLTSDQLLAAVRINPERDQLVESPMPTENSLLDWCANLLVLDPQQTPPVWRVSHLSVAEYLEEHQVTLMDPRYFVATACLRLLIETNWEMSAEEDTTPNDILQPHHPLEKYVAVYWAYHVESQEGQGPSCTVARLLKNFLGSPMESSTQYRGWHHEFLVTRDMPRFETGTRSVDLRSLRPEGFSIFALCSFSFYSLLADWWENESIDPARTNDDGSSLLSLAAGAGCLSACRKLVQRKATAVDMQLQHGVYGSALAAAAYMGKLEIVQFLVREGKATVDMQLQHGVFSNALEAARKRPNWAGDKGAIAQFLS